MPSRTRACLTRASSTRLLLLPITALFCGACIYPQDFTFERLAPGDVTAVWVDVDGTRPAAGAVTLLEGAGLSRYAAADGRVTFRALPPGKHAFFTTWDMDLDGVADRAARVAFELGTRNGRTASMNLGTLRLQPTVTLRGTVRLSSGASACDPGAPPPAETRVVLDGLPVDVPVVEGAFTLPGLPGGTYVLAASAPGHLSNTVTVEARSAGDSAAEVRVDALLCLVDVSAERVPVSGSVEAAPNDRGLEVPPAITLTAQALHGARSTFPDLAARGFTLANTVPGIYALEVDLPEEFLPLRARWFIIPPGGAGLAPLVAWPRERGEALAPVSSSSSVASSSGPSASSSSSSSRASSSVQVSSSRAASASSSASASSHASAGSSAASAASSGPASSSAASSAGTVSSSGARSSSQGAGSSSSAAMASSSAACTENTTRCLDAAVMVCTNGTWVEQQVCPGYCLDGACRSDCTEGTAECSTESGMPVVRRCSEAEQWVTEQACSGATPYCANATCVASVRSCQELLMSGVTTSGSYVLDVDGNGPDAPFNAWCDMEHDGGGWTLVRASAGQRTALSVEGEPAPGFNRHLSVARFTGVAAVSQQVHIRTQGNPADSITSVAGSSPILRLRQGLPMVDPAPACDVYPIADWTTPAGSTRLSQFRFSCCPQVGNYPDGVFHACNFGGGMHWFSTSSSWTSGGSNALEMYFR